MTLAEVIHWIKARCPAARLLNDHPAFTREEQARLRAEGKTNYVDNPGFEVRTDGWTRRN